MQTCHLCAAPALTTESTCAPRRGSESRFHLTKSGFGIAIGGLLRFLLGLPAGAVKQLQELCH